MPRTTKKKVLVIDRTIFMAELEKLILEFLPDTFFCDEHMAKYENLTERVPFLLCLIGENQAHDLTNCQQVIAVVDLSYFKNASDPYSFAITIHKSRVNREKAELLLKVFEELGIGGEIEYKDLPYEVLYQP